MKEQQALIGCQFDTTGNLSFIPFIPTSMEPNLKTFLNNYLRDKKNPPIQAIGVKKTHISFPSYKATNYVTNLTFIENPNNKKELLFELVELEKLKNETEDLVLVTNINWYED